MIHKFKPLLIAYLFSLVIFSLVAPSHSMQIVTEDSLDEADVGEHGNTISVVARSVDVEFVNLTQLPEVTEDSIKIVKSIQIGNLPDELCSGVNSPSLYPKIEILSLHINFYDIQTDHDAQAVIEAVDQLYENEGGLVWRPSPYMTSLKAKAIGEDKERLETSLGKHFKTKYNEVNK